MTNDGRGFLRLQDSADYKSFGGFRFESTDKAFHYNKSLKYDFYEEAQKAKERYAGKHIKK